MHRSNVAAFAVAAFLACTASVPAAPSSDAALRTALQKALDTYVAARAKPEHISAAALSISLKGRPIGPNLAAGTTQYGGGRRATPADLYEIGSITKSFTAVALLHLEAAGKLNTEDRLGKFLPQYPAWKNVTIHRLLDMTSPIVGYDNVASVGRIMGNDPNHDFTPEELVAAAYPHNGNPKPVSGWTYSNTNYILAQMIIEKVGGKPYRDVIADLCRQAGLTDTYYQSNRYPQAIRDRMVSGYFFNHGPDDVLLRPLLGHDVKDDSVSWMQAAGGIVASMPDVARWARALYEGPLLAPKQRRELMTLVSNKTGKPIAAASAAEPAGFGLGVGAGYRPTLGSYWYYQGETLGYRVLYGYFPKSQAVIVIGLNSQPDNAQNHNGALMEQLYGLLERAGRL
jgi:D-alanyl-D-alanine carboxypeptidase